MRSPISKAQTAKNQRILQIRIYACKLKLELDYDGGGGWW
jgi:hypothetical protein